MFLAQAYAKTNRVAFFFTGRPPRRVFPGIAKGTRRVAAAVPDPARSGLSSPREKKETRGKEKKEEPVE